MSQTLTVLKCVPNCLREKAEICPSFFRFNCSFYLPSRIVLSGGLKEWKVGEGEGWGGGESGVPDSMQSACRASLSPFLM